MLDHSGSMAGASIEQARAALQLALARLRPIDRFNVIRFNHRTDAVFPRAQAADRDEPRPPPSATSTRIRADGGTEMLPALQLALDGAEHADRLRQVIFLTDGAVGNEERLFQAIRERLGGSRLFTIGIGSAPNSHFMREAARLGRGTFTYIGSPAEVKEKMTALFRKLESPVLADVAARAARAARRRDRARAPIPDLYVGEPIVVAVRAQRVARGGGRARTVRRHALGGPRAAAPGRRRRRASPCTGRGPKIATLLDRRRAGAGDDDVRHAVLDVALRHHLVSAYTSLVAVDVTPARPADAALTTHAMPTNLPDGWEYDAGSSDWAQGATPGPLHLAVGLAALLLAAALAAGSPAERALVPREAPA